MNKIFTVRDARRYKEQKEMWDEAKAEKEAKAKAEQQTILDQYPQIGILHRTNPQFSRTDPNATVMQVVFYVWSGDSPYTESTDLAALVEVINRG